MDLTLLQSYKDHVVGRVWIGEPRVELKLINHGDNVMPYPTQLTVKGYVDR